MSEEQPNRFFDLAMMKIAGQATDAELAELDGLLAADASLQGEYDRLAAESRLLKEALPLAEATQATEGEFPEWARPNLQLEVQNTFRKTDDERVLRELEMRALARAELAGLAPQKPEIEVAYYEAQPEVRPLFWSRFLPFGGGIAVVAFVVMLTLSGPEENVEVPRLGGVVNVVTQHPQSHYFPSIKNFSMVGGKVILPQELPPLSMGALVWELLRKNIEIAVLDEAGTFEVSAEKEPQKFFNLTGLKLKSFSDPEIFMDQWLKPRLKNAKGPSASIYYNVSSDELKVIGKINQITFEKSFQVKGGNVGKIANVDPLSGSLILNIGSAHGFKVGAKFNVFRNNKLIGRIVVTRLSTANTGLSVAQRSEGLGAPAGAQFQVGDVLGNDPVIGVNLTATVNLYLEHIALNEARNHQSYLWGFAGDETKRFGNLFESDGTVYVGSDDKKLYAINGKSGVKLWEFETGDDVRSSPAIGSDGTVYVGSWDGNLYAINGKSGVKLWEFETGGNVTSSPAIGSDGTVYVGSWDGNLYAINGKSGVKLWEFETGGEVYSSPAIGSDGTVYIASYDKKLYAINGKSGVKLWEFETGDDVRSSPAIGSDGTVYVISDQKNILALDGKKLGK
jgi:outer membrane protein assembly factor BamB